jgi:putative YhdH/YhfP family quinone oxidoreductase
MDRDQRFDCFQVRRDDSGQVQGAVTAIETEQLPAGDVLIQVEWSSLNYKDALAAAGHAGVVRRLPHVPGIDAAGRVLESTTPEFAPGQAVLVTGYELGGGVWGGWSERIRVPAAWVVPRPVELSAREAMILGTAGFTAAQCVLRLQQNGIVPASGPIVVTGATGGVGCLAVKLLGKLGYRTTASTGKLQEADWLKQLGAETVVGRDELQTPPDKPLGAARWAGAVDTVGGETLASLVRSTQVNGCVTACGLVAGAQLPLTVFPFILRGVVLAGVTSQNCPMPLRLEIWRRFAQDWRLANLSSLAREVQLQGLPEAIDQIRAGQIRGRVVVRLTDED